MKFLKIAVVAALLIPAIASACPHHCVCDRDGNIVVDSRSYTNVNNNSLRNTIKNSQSQNQGQSQSSVNQNQSSSSVNNSGNSTNTNVNNVAGGSATIAKGAVTNNVTATGGAGGAGGSASVGNVSTGASTASATASAAGAGANNGNGSNNTTITTNIPRQVATAYAAALTSGADTCLGSTSGGAQTGFFGLSLGGTREDKYCVLIKQVQLLHSLGQDEAACRRARMGKEGKAIDDAMSAAGVDCKAYTPVPAPVATNLVTQAELDRAIKKTLQK